MVPQGFRLNADGYIEALRQTLIPWMRRGAAALGGASPAPFLFQQDGAPAHTSRKTTAFLDEQKIPFIRPDQWPPSSPDLNPLDYSIWSLVTAGTAGVPRPSSVAALKRQVVLGVTWTPRRSARLAVDSGQEFKNALKLIFFIKN